MIRITLLVVAATLLLAGSLALGSGDRAEAGAPPSNIPGDADCSQSVTARDALYDALYSADQVVNGLACQTNGNVICGDGINLDDALAILEYSAGLVPELPAGCPDIGQDAVHGTASSGTATIHGTYLFDLDAGLESPTPGTDIHWSVETKTPLDAALDSGPPMALLHTSLNFDDISYSQVVGAEWSDSPIHMSQFPVDGAIAVQTTDGNYAKIEIVNLAYDLEIRWVTYSPGQ